MFPALRLSLLGLMVISLSFSAGCDAKLNSKSNGPRMRGFVDGRRPRVSMSITNDVSDTWRPLSEGSRFLTIATQYADNIQKFDQKFNTDRRVDAYQINLVDYGYQIVDTLDSYSDLTDWERYFCEEILFQQARVFANTDHLEDAYLSLSRAVALGYSDTERVARSSLTKFSSDPRFSELFRTMAEIEPGRTTEKIRSTFRLSNDRAFAMPVQTMDNKSIDLQQELGYWNVIFITGTWCPPCKEMAANVSSIANEFKNSGIRFLGLSFEKGDGVGPRNLTAIKAFQTDHGLEFPFFAGKGDLFDKFRNSGNFPSVIVMDNMGRIRATAKGYHSTSVLRGMLNEVLCVQADVQSL